jgi:predicted DsbA family dithiol-disulfide isomerase
MTIHLSYVSDVLCVWAYVAEVRLEQLRREYGNQVEFEYRFIPIFGATRYRIGEGWSDRGGYEGFGAHVRKVAARFPEVSVSTQVWGSVAPTTCAMAHEMLCAVRLLEEAGTIGRHRSEELGGRTPFEHVIWEVRRAFFEQARDISDRDVLLDIANRANLPVAAIESKIASGEAMAEVCRDIELRDQKKVEGSPTLILNQGRQKLYGNVGYRVISANLRQLIDQPTDQASWC